jgi:hypothetical protein
MGNAPAVNGSARHDSVLSTTLQWCFMASSPVETGISSLPATRSKTLRRALAIGLGVPLAAIVILELTTLLAEQQTEQQRQAIAIAGGKSELQRRVPGWLQTVMGADFHTFLDRTVIYKVSMTGEKIGDVEVSKVVDLPNLEILDLEDSTVTDASLPTLSRLKSLKLLSLVNTQVSDISALAELPVLDTLILNFSQVRDQGLAPLKQFPKLQTLGAGGLKLTDIGVQEIAQCQSLNGVNIAGANLGPTGLDPLMSLQELKFLSVKAAKYDPANLQALKTAHPGCTVAE